MTLSLHIGTSKTGTTALQHYMQSFPEHCLSLPFAPPSLCLLLGEGPTKNDVQRRLGIEDAELACGQLREALARQAGRSCLVSSEFIFNAGLTGNIAQLRAEFSAWEKVQVILYLRHPVSHFASEVSQRVKSGMHDPEKVMHVSRAFYSYAKICDRWAEHFDLVVRDYTREKPHLVKGFCAATGLPFDSAKLPDSHENRSLNKNSLELARRINEIADKGADKLRRRLINDLAGFGVDGPAIAIPQDARKTLMQMAEDENTRLVGRYLDAPLAL